MPDALSFLGLTEHANELFRHFDELQSELPRVITTLELAKKAIRAR